MIIALTVMTSLLLIIPLTTGRATQIAVIRYIEIQTAAAINDITIAIFRWILPLTESALAFPKKSMAASKPNIDATIEMMTKANGMALRRCAPSTIHLVILSRCCWRSLFAMGNLSNLK